MKEFRPSDIDPDENARLVKTAVTPRPIAWISTVDEAGNENLAPFSSYTYVVTNRPVLVFNTASKASGRMKDTARNVLDTEEFAVNVVTRSTLEAMDSTAADLPPGESEFEFSDVERSDCREIAAPRVADAPVTMECTLYDHVEVYEKMMILGEVVYFHVSEEVITDGQVDARKLATVGRLGGPRYTLAEPTEFERQY